MADPQTNGQFEICMIADRLIDVLPYDYENPAWRKLLEAPPCGTVICWRGLNYLIYIDLGFGLWLLPISMAATKMIPSHFLLAHTFAFFQFVFAIIYSLIVLYSYSSSLLKIFSPQSEAWLSFPDSFFRQEGWV